MNIFRFKPNEAVYRIARITGRPNFLTKHNANPSVLLCLDCAEALAMSEVTLVLPADFDLEEVHSRAPKRPL
jgi:hypothetical protein